MLSLNVAFMNFKYIVKLILQRKYSLLNSHFKWKMILLQVDNKVSDTQSINMKSKINIRSTLCINYVTRDSLNYSKTNMTNYWTSCCGTYVHTHKTVHMDMVDWLKVYWSLNISASALSQDGLQVWRVWA